MKKFESPKIEVIKFRDTNMITTSYVGPGTDSEWDDESSSDVSTIEY